MPSYKFHSQPRRALYVRALGNARRELKRVFEEECERRGVTTLSAAEHLGKATGFIANGLSGRSDLTIEAIAEMAHALGRTELEIRIGDHPADKPAGRSNRPVVTRTDEARVLVTGHPATRSTFGHNRLRFLDE